MLQLKHIVFEKNLLLDFIDSNLVQFDYSRENLFEKNHSLASYELNLKQKDYIVSSTLLFDTPVEDIYAFRQDEEFALYLLVDFDDELIKNLIVAIGNPINADQNDINSKDYDLLLWKTQEMVVSFVPDHSKNYKTNSKDHFLLIITNCINKPLFLGLKYLFKE